MISGSPIRVKMFDKEVLHPTAELETNQGLNGICEYRFVSITDGNNNVYSVYVTAKSCGSQSSAACYHKVTIVTPMLRSPILLFRGLSGALKYNGRVYQDSPYPDHFTVTRTGLYTDLSFTIGLTVRWMEEGNWVVSCGLA